MMTKMMSEPQILSNNITKFLDTLKRHVLLVDTLALEIDPPIFMLSTKGHLAQVSTQVRLILTIAVIYLGVTPPQVSSMIVGAILVHVIHLIHALHQRHKCPSNQTMNLEIFSIVHTPHSYLDGVVAILINLALQGSPTPSVPHFTQVADLVQFSNLRDRHGSPNFSRHFPYMVGFF
jgi:hypothetical protein